MLVSIKVRLKNNKTMSNGYWKTKTIRKSSKKHLKNLANTMFSRRHLLRSEHTKRKGSTFVLPFLFSSRLTMKNPCKMPQGIYAYARGNVTFKFNYNFSSELQLIVEKYLSLICCIIKIDML